MSVLLSHLCGGLQGHSEVTGPAEGEEPLNLLPEAFMDSRPASELGGSASMIDDGEPKTAGDNADLLSLALITESLQVQEVLEEYSSFF